uniref:Uncharacterized protein n=1 Tax=Cacopsylla melanoneura TaxID=428564 RepID=A0A8D9EMS0_9HEMI
MYTIQQQVHKNYKKLKYLFLSKMVRMILNSFCQECLLVSNKNEKSWTKCERGFIELTKFAVPCKIFGCSGNFFVVVGWQRLPKAIIPPFYIVNKEFLFNNFFLL